MSSDPPIEELVEIGAYLARRSADERGLVLAALDVAHWIHLIEGRHRLYVCVDDAARARAEVLAYERDRDRTLEMAAEPEARRREVGPSLILYPLVLSACFLLQEGDGGAFEERGILSGAATIDQGEWWRPLTALTLHGDSGHLLGNLGAGLCFAWLACGVYGAGLAWVLAIASGFFGNVVTALFYYPFDHLALGASGAVFGALGTLAGHGLRAGFRSLGGRDPIRSAAPLVAGLFLLAFLGGGDARTDVLAHIFGFASGTVLGWMADALALADRGGRWLGPLAGTLALAAIALSWWIALR